MTNVRSDYWIPTLMKLAKSFVRKCPVCKKLNSLPYPGVNPGPLPNGKW